ncbi:MAG: tetratricopeptide repeat protein, partial [Thermodesulfobacteriota bacterium]|nr:tetratricopeptide repeat protein [Thermodesulfobacteriota bacterium]
MADSGTFSPFSLDDIPFDQTELKWLIEFVRGHPGRLSAAVVPGPIPGDALIKRLSLALNLPLTMAAADSPPAMLGAQAVSLGDKDTIFIIPLDGRRVFNSEKEAHEFWRSLNFQRERLSQGRVRTCFLLNDKNEKLFNVLADDLSDWVRIFRFPEAVLPLKEKAALQAESRLSGLEGPPSAEWLPILRDQLRRAREAGLPEAVLADQYAGPLFRALVEQGLVKEARRVWEQDLMDGRALTLSDQADRTEILRTRIDLARIQGDSKSWDRFTSGLLEESQAKEGEAVPEEQRRLMAAYGERGDFLSATGDLTGAEKNYRSALALSKRLTVMDPANTLWQSDLSVSLERIGDILYAQGDLKGALKAFEQSRDIAERLTGMDPANTGRQRALSVSHNKIGDILRARGDLKGALKAFEQSRDIRERLAAMDPANTGRQRDLSVSLVKIGDILYAQGDLKGALKAFEQSRDIRERLTGMDPANTLWQRDLSVSLVKVGDILYAQGDLKGALKAYGQSRDIRERLAAMDPANTLWQRD